jgi:hypothetical protein
MSLSLNYKVKVLRVYGPYFADKRFFYRIHNNGSCVRCKGWFKNRDEAQMKADAWIGEQESYMSSQL